VGVGKIGSRVARICQSAFNMQVVGYDHFVVKGEEIARELEIPLDKLYPVVPCLKLVGKIRACNHMSGETYSRREVLSENPSSSR